MRRQWAGWDATAMRICLYEDDKLLGTFDSDGQHVRVVFDENLTPTSGCVIYQLGDGRFAEQLWDFDARGSYETAQLRHWRDLVNEWDSARWPLPPELMRLVEGATPDLSAVALPKDRPAVNSAALRNLSRLRAAAMRYALDPVLPERIEALQRAVLDTGDSDLHGIAADAAQPIRELLHSGRQILCPDAEGKPVAVATVVDLSNLSNEDRQFAEEMQGAGKEYLNGLSSSEREAFEAEERREALVGLWGAALEAAQQVGRIMPVPAPAETLVDRGRELAAFVHAARRLRQMVREYESARTNYEPFVHEGQAIPFAFDPDVRRFAEELTDRFSKLWFVLSLSPTADPGPIGDAQDELQNAMRAIFPRLNPDAAPDEVMGGDWSLALTLDADPLEVDAVGRALDALERAEAVIREKGRNGQQNDATSQTTVVSQNDERDVWLYERINRGDASADIVAELKATARKNRWGIISSWPGIKNAARRYARRKNLPPPAPRQTKFSSKSTGKRRPCG